MGVLALILVAVGSVWPIANLVSDANRYVEDAKLEYIQQQKQIDTLRKEVLFLKKEFQSTKKEADESIKLNNSTNIE